jgi:hypothetical protein
LKGQLGNAFFQPLPEDELQHHTYEWYR